MEDEAQLLREICRRVEAQLSDEGLALSAQWRQALAESSDDTVSIRALLASGLLVGLTSDVEDVAAAVRAHSTALQLTEDGRNVRRLSEAERSASSQQLPLLTVASSTTVLALQSPKAAPISEHKQPQRGSTPGKAVQGVRYFGRVISLRLEPFGQYYRRAGYLWAPELSGLSQFIEVSFADLQAAIRYGSAVSFHTVPNTEKGSVADYLAMDVRVEADDAVKVIPPSRVYPEAEGTVATYTPRAGAMVEGAVLTGRVYAQLKSAHTLARRNAGFIWCPDLANQVFFIEKNFVERNVKIQYGSALEFTLHIDVQAAGTGASIYQARAVKVLEETTLPPLLPEAKLKVDMLRGRATSTQSSTPSRTAASAPGAAASAAGTATAAATDVDDASKTSSPLVGNLAANQHGSSGGLAGASTAAVTTAADAQDDTESSGSLMSRLAASQRTSVPSVLAEPADDRTPRTGGPPVEGERYIGRIRGLLRSSRGGMRRAGYIWAPALDRGTLFREVVIEDRNAPIAFGQAVSFTVKIPEKLDDPKQAYEALSLRLEPHDAVPSLPPNRFGDGSATGPELGATSDAAPSSAAATSGAAAEVVAAAAPPRPAAPAATERMRYRNMASEYELPTETHKCTHCGQAFYKVPLLNEHIKVKHPNFDEYKKLLEAERAQQQEAGLGDAPKVTTAVTADTLRTALLQAGDASTAAALLAWLETLRMQEYQPQFSAAGLHTLEDVRSLAADKEASLLETLKLQLGPKKVRGAVWRSKSGLGLLAACEMRGGGGLRNADGGTPLARSSRRRLG